MISKKLFNVDNAYRKRETQELVAFCEAKNMHLSVLLTQVFQQNIIDSIAQNAIGKKIFLKNGLEMKNYEQIANKKEVETIYLEYVVINEEEIKTTGCSQTLKDIVDEMKENIFFCGKKTLWNRQFEMCWNGVVKAEGDKMSLLMEGMYDMYHIPVHIRIAEGIAMKQEGQEEKFPYILDEEKEIFYIAYPLEELLGDCFADIMEKCELLHEMDRYDRTFEILSEKTLNSRKIQSIVQNKCAQKKIQIDEKRFQKIVSYRDYNYMKKRWKMYLKSRGKKSRSGQR